MQAGALFQREENMDKLMLLIAGILEITWAVSMEDELGLHPSPALFHNGRGIHSKRGLSFHGA